MVQPSTNRKMNSGLQHSSATINENIIDQTMAYFSGIPSHALTHTDVLGGDFLGRPSLMAGNPIFNGRPLYMEEERQKEDRERMENI